MTTYGDWQTDADLAWVSAGSVQTGTVNGDNAIGVSQVQTGGDVTAYPPGDHAGATTEAWTVNKSCTATSSFNDGPYFRVTDSVDYLGNPNGTTADWNTQWLTLISQTVTANSSTLPPSVYSNGGFTDPRVTGVEWEPTSTPLDQKLVARLMYSYGAMFVAGDQYYLHGPTPYSGSAPYAPGYMNAATMSATPLLGVITATTDSTVSGGVSGSVEVTSLAIPLSNDTYAIPLTLLDQNTETQTPPTSARTWYSQFSADLMRAFRPRYRLLYSDAARVNTWVRTVQRGDQFAGAPRTVQNNSQQASLRNIGFR